MTNDDLERQTMHIDGLGPIEIFDSATKAANHIIDHLLTFPESEAWALVSEINTSLGSARYKREAVAEKVSNLLDPAQGLYDVYANKIKAGVAQAQSLEWLVISDLQIGLCVAMSVEGLLVVIDGGTVRTAFFPGLGSAAATRFSKEVGGSGYLKRELGMRTPSKRGRESKRKKRGRWAHSQDQLESAPETDEKKIYQDIFLPAWNFVRDQVDFAFDMYGRDLPNRRDYGLLNSVLPATRPRFVDWQVTRNSVSPEE